MNETTTTLRDAFIERYPASQNTGYTKILRLIQQADIKISSILPIRNDSFDIPLAAGVPNRKFADFPLGEGGSSGSTIVRIFEATYIRSAGEQDHWPLTGRDPRWLDKHRHGWRMGAAGEPSEYAVDASTVGRRIWWLQKPINATVGGFPTIRLECSTHKVLAYGDALPTDLPDMEIYLAHMSWAWAKTNDRNAVGGWLDEFRQQIREAERFLYNFVEQENPNIVPNFYPRGRVV